jgi:RNAse (barnase) inhibitor barstar
MQRYVIDGEQFSTLEEFAACFSRHVLRDHHWNGNLDAFNDILRGGFGTPEEGFCLVWRNAERSKQLLGYGETTRQLELRLAKCHPANKSAIAAELEAATLRKGQTVFDWLIEIIRQHGPGGREGEDGVLLELH